MNNTIHYLYKWQFSPELSFQCFALDIESAKAIILSDVISLCIKHEKTYQYFQLNPIKSNKDYKIDELLIRKQLCLILCLAYNISSYTADDNIDECYDYLNYTIVHNAIKKLLVDVQPILLEQ
jgi:hypothetical protein